MHKIIHFPKTSSLLPPCAWHSKGLIQSISSPNKLHLSKRPVSGGGGKRNHNTNDSRLSFFGSTVKQLVSKATVTLLLGIGAQIRDFVSGCSYCGSYMASMSLKCELNTMVALDSGGLDSLHRHSTQRNMRCYFCVQKLGSLFTYISMAPSINLELN